MAPKLRTAEIPSTTTITSSAIATTIDI